MSRGFDPNSSKWRCCCFRLTTGVCLMIGVMMLFCSYGFIRTVVAVANVNLRKGIYWDHVALICLEMVICALSLLAGLVAVFGVLKRKRGLLVPYILLQILRLIVYLALVISGKLLDDKRVFDKSQHTSLFVISLVLLAFLVTFEIYHGYLIFRCVNLIKEEQDNLQNKSNVYRTVHKETIRRKRIDELRTKRDQKRGSDSSHSTLSRSDRY